MRRRKWLVGGLLLAAVLSGSCCNLVKAQDSRAQLKQLEQRVAVRPNDPRLRQELAAGYYQQAGFPAYFEQWSWVATETATRRRHLLSSLPAIEPVAARQCQQQLVKLLSLDPANPTALILTGNYHRYYQQWPTARWYFQKALAAAPERLESRWAAADFYLEMGEPQAVQQLLAGLTDPVSQWRLGLAYLQQGKFQPAQSCWERAQPLDQTAAAIRGKDLLKIALARGDWRAAARFWPAELPAAAVPVILFTELRGWQAWLSGDPDQADQYWAQGQTLHPQYPLWQSNRIWLRARTGQEFLDPLPDLKDPDLNAVLKILEGQAYSRELEWDQAYQSFREGLRLDRRCLIGFWEAGQAQLMLDQDSRALNLFTQGLAINPDFGPLLEVRAALYQRLHQRQRAGADRAAALKSRSLAGQQARVKGFLITVNRYQTSLQLQGQLQQLTGVWVSHSGREWQWYPWWGGAIRFEERLKECWVVPSGPGLSGEALYLTAVKEGPGEGQ